MKNHLFTNRKFYIMKHFQISFYLLDEIEIVVTLEKYSIEIPVTIPRKKFEFWLRLNERLTWEFNTSDHQGQHQQFCGTMSLSEYWDSDSSYIKQDLYDYITTHPINRDGVIFSNSVDSLLLAFELHNASRINPQPFQERWEHDQKIIN
jgi:hypothetical protein